MGFGNPRIRRMLLLILLLGLLLVILTRARIRIRTVRQRYHNQLISEQGLGATKGIVMAKMMHDDIQWALDLSSAWRAYIYTGENPAEPGYLELPSHQGREAIPYLTFIVDHYDNLPDFTAFVHANRDQWHNDILGASTADALLNLRLDTVERSGYVNLRCSHEPGCPTSVNPHNPTEIDIANNDTRAHFADIYAVLFDVSKDKVPEHIGAPCCAQFVVTRQQIRKRARKDYIRMLEWATETTVTDSSGIGWIFEMTWHIVFGMSPVHCPPFEQCRCDLFEWCGSLPRRYEPLVRGAHPWLGSKLGRVLGNDNAAGDWS